MGLTVSKSPWTIFITGEALVLKIQKIEPDGSRGYFMLVDEKAELFASIFIEPVNKCKTSKECRDLVWKHGNPGWQNPQNVKLSEIGEISILELLVPSYKEDRFDNRTCMPNSLLRVTGWTYIFRKCATRIKTGACLSGW